MGVVCVRPPPRWVLFASVRFVACYGGHNTSVKLSSTPVWLSLIFINNYDEGGQACEPGIWSLAIEMQARRNPRAVFLYVYFFSFRFDSIPRRSSRGAWSSRACFLLADAIAPDGVLFDSHD